MRITIKMLVLLIAISIFSNIALAKTDIMPLSEVRAGMKGVGKTVLSGTKIENFDVEVISILEGEAPNKDLILVRTSGDVIKRTGGIASGMSGSPIYIDGRLIGAIGYGWQLADHRIGMVTPIESMLELLEIGNSQLENKEMDLKTPIKLGNQDYKKVYFTRNVDAKRYKKDGILLARPVSTPLFISGMNGRSKKRLTNSLKGYDVAPMDGGGIVKNKNGAVLKPGSAVAVQLVRGDINVSSIGTLTYRDGNQILAFGHPFLSKGNSNYLLSAAYIHQMITSIKMPFKLGSPAELKGTITQDRGAGIAGKIGKFPNVIPMDIKVKDKDLKRTRKYNLQIIQNEEFIESLASSVVLQAVDSTIDRVGEGTAKVNVQIMGNKVPLKTIEVKNLYYSSNDVAGATLSDLLESLSLVVYNSFHKIDIASIKVDIEIEKIAKIALIEEINVDKNKVKPGEEINVEVSLRPYREKVLTKNIKVKVPEDFIGDRLEVHVISGQEFNLSQVAEQEESQSSTNSIKTLEELIDIYKMKKKNNELVVEIRPVYTPDMDFEEDKEEKGTGGIRGNYQDSTITEYILKGDLIKEIDVIGNISKKNIKEEN